MEDVRSYFHIGMSKTGSTYLQKYVFPYLTDFQYIKKHDYPKYKTEIDTDLKLLFSSEKDRGIKKEIEEINRYRPNSKVIIVFREHFDWIKSKYKYYIRKFGHLKFEDYFDKVLIPDLDMHEKYYSSIIDKMNKEFPGNCLFLTYDMFKTNPDFFFRKLHRFLKTEGQKTYVNKVVKPAFNNRQLHFIRKFNRFYRYHKSTSNSKIIRKLHYKYREMLLHTTAQIGQIVPVTGEPVDRELARSKDLIQDRFREDWQTVQDYAYR